MSEPRMTETPAPELRREDVLFALAAALLDPENGSVWSVWGDPDTAEVDGEFSLSAFIGALPSRARGALDAEGRGPLWDRLLTYWNEDEARMWLASPQPLLGDAVPSELLAKGEGERLHGILDTLDSGAFL